MIELSHDERMLLIEEITSAEQALHDARTASNRMDPIDMDPIDTVTSRRTT